MVARSITQASAAGKSLCPPLIRREAKLRKTAPSQNCATFDVRSGVDQAALFKKEQERPSRDFAAIVRQHETGAGDLVILE